MFTSQGNNILTGNYFYFPIINENIYNPYVNQYFMGYHNYNASSYVNNYWNSNEYVYLYDSNLNKIQENRTAVNLNKKQSVQMECISSEEYFPVQETDRRHKKKGQNQRRNTTSSLINQILTFLSQQKKSGFLVSKIIKLKQIKGKQFLASYFQYQLIQRRHLKRYLGVKEFIRHLIVHKQSAGSTQQYNKHILFREIARRVVAYYLRNDSVQVVINSKKLLPINRKFHFEQARIILRNLIQIGRSQKIKI